MGCPSGSCPTDLPSSDDGDGEAEVALASELAVAGRDSLREGDACCAFCAGIELDPCEPPAHAREMIEQGRACPLAVVAYKAAYAAKQGKVVALEANGGLPRLLIDGKEVDPIEQYRRGYCSKEAC